MADPQWDLINSVISRASLKDVAARHVTAEMFADPLAQRVFTYIDEHYKKYRAVPSPETLAKRFKRGQFTLSTPEPPAYYLDAFLRQHLRQHGADLLLRASQELADDPFKVMEELANTARAFAGRASGTAIDSEHTGNWKSRLQAYRRRQSGEMLGIPTPFPTWNNMTFGLQKQDYVVITARPGVGKSWFVLLIALYLMVKQGKRVLFFTKEMSITALETRADAMMYELPYNPFRKGSLTDFDRKRYIAGLKATSRARKRQEIGEIIYIADPYMSPSTLDAKIEQYHPDVVVVDGMYLMIDVDGGRSTEQHQRVANVSRKTRAIAQDRDVPLIATSQIHRMPGNMQKNWQSLTLGDLAFSDAIGQDAEQVYALIATDDMRERDIIMVKSLKVREEKPQDWGVSWNLTDMKNVGDEIEVHEDGQLSDQTARTSDGKPMADDGDEVLIAAGAWDSEEVPDAQSSEDVPTPKKKKKKVGAVTRKKVVAQSTS